VHDEGEQAGGEKHNHGDRKAVRSAEVVCGLEANH